MPRPWQGGSARRASPIAATLPPHSGASCLSVSLRSRDAHRETDVYLLSRDYISPSPFSFFASDLCARQRREVLLFKSSIYYRASPRRYIARCTARLTPPTRRLRKISTRIWFLERKILPRWDERTGSSSQRRRKVSAKLSDSLSVTSRLRLRIAERIQKREKAGKVTSGQGERRREKERGPRKESGAW